MAEWLEKLENDPRFKLIPYSDQVALRGQLAFKKLSEDPRFQTLDAEHRNDLIAKAAYRKPVFQDPRFEQRMNTFMEFYTQNPGKGNTVIANALATQAAANQSLVIRGLTRLLSNENVDILGALGFGNEALSKLGHNDLSLYEQAYDPDAEKTAEYLRYVASKDERMRTIAGLMEGMGNVAGFGVDFAATYLIPPLKTARMAMVKPLQNAAKTLGTNSVKRWLLGRALPGIAQNTIDGIALGARDLTLQWLNGQREEDLWGANKAATIAKTFGEWALIDYAIGLGVDMLPLAGLGLKAFRKRAYEKAMKGFADVPPAERLDIIRKNAAGRSPDEWADLSEYQRLRERSILQEEDYKTLTSWEGRPEPETQAFARMNGYDFVIDENEYILQNVRTGTVTRTKNLSEVQNILSENFNKHFAKLSEAEQVERFGRIPNWVQRNLAQSTNDSIFDPLVHMDPNTKAYKKVYGDLKSSDVIPLSSRGAVSVLEAEELAKLDDYVVDRFSVGVDEAGLRKLSDDGRFFDPGAAQTLVKGQDNNAIFLGKKVATPQEYQTALEKAKKMQANLDGPASIEDLARAELMSKGYEGAWIDNTQQSLIAFFPENIKIISDQLNVKTGKITGLAKINKWGGFKPERIEGQIVAEGTGIIPKKNLIQDKKLLARMTADISRTMDPVEVKKLSKMYLNETGSQIGVNIERAEGVKHVVVKKSTASEFIDEGRVTAKYKGDTLEITVPEKVTTTAQQKKFLKNFYESLDEVTEATGGKPVQTDFSQLYQKEVRKFAAPGSLPDNKVEWLREAAKVHKSQLYQIPSGGWGIKPPQGLPITANSIDELAERFITEHISPDAAKRALSAYGAELKKVDDGWTVYVKGKGSKQQVIARGNTPAEALRASNFAPQKIDTIYAPDMVVLGEEGAKLQIKGNLVTGSSTELLNFLNRFENTKLLSRMNRIYNTKKGTIDALNEVTYTVKIDDLGSIKHFHSKKDAIKWVQQDWKNYEKLREMAAKKGFHLSYNGPKIQLIKEGQKFELDSYDQVATVMKSHPDPDDALKEFIPDSEYHQIKTTVEETKIPETVGVEKQQVNVPPREDIKSGYELRRILGQFIEPMNAWMQKTTEKLGLKALWKKYREVSKASLYAKAEIDETMRLVTDILSVKKRSRGGKVVNELLGKDRRIVIKRYMTSQSDEARELVRRLEEMTDEEVRAARELRALLGEEATLPSGQKTYTGLFRKFGVDPWKYLTDYLPRVKDRVLMDNYKTLNDMDLVEMNKRLYGRAIPKDVDFFALHSRLEDVTEMALEEDVLALLSRYVSSGHKHYYLNQIWQEMDELLKTDQSIPAFVHMRVNRWRDMMFGTAVTDGERLARNVTTKLFKTLGFTDQKAATMGRDFTKWMFSINVLTNMAWRPWLPIRNVHQPLTTLAARWGFDSVRRGYKQAFEATDETIEYLRRVGIVKGTPPVFAELADETMVGKLTHRGLTAYKRSDDITRAVAYFTARDQYMDAVRKWQAGTITKESQFIDLAGLNNLGQNQIDEVMDLVRKGNYDQGLFTYANDVVEETMFLYDKANAPQAFHGLLGKFFGQYGTYSANYIQNVLRGITRGGVGKKALFVARSATLGMGLYAAYRELGINAKNFLPWSPMFFSGGPWFNLAGTAIRSMSPTYAGRQARAELQDQLGFLGLPLKISTHKDGKVSVQLNVPRMYPGYYQYRMIARSLEASMNGDYWRAFVALTSSPLRPTNDNSFF